MAASGGKFCICLCSTVLINVLRKVSDEKCSFFLFKFRSFFPPEMNLSFFSCIATVPETIFFCCVCNKPNLFPALDFKKNKENISLRSRLFLFALLPFLWKNLGYNFNF